MEDLRGDNGRTGLNQLWEICFAWNVCLVLHHRFNCKKEQGKVLGRHLREGLKNCSETERKDMGNMFIRLAFAGSSC